MSYAQAKGRAAPAPSGMQRAPAVPIASQDERDRIAENYALVKTHLPEFVPFIKGLHEQGLIDGLRAIRSVQLLNGKEP